jgi:hypothetical protein
MAIPEHSKCVAINKRLRHNHQNGNWCRVRVIRRKNGEIKLKMRIRQMLKAELEMEKSKIMKKWNMKYTDYMKSVVGKYYRKWGKYDD